MIPRQIICGEGHIHVGQGTDLMIVWINLGMHLAIGLLPIFPKKTKTNRNLCPMLVYDILDNHENIFYC